MHDSVYSRDLILTIQKRPLVKMLRDWREESESSIEVDLLNDIIREIEDGHFDG